MRNLKNDFWEFVAGISEFRPVDLSLAFPREAGLQRILVKTSSELYDYYLFCVESRQSGYVSLFGKPEIEEQLFDRLFVDLDFPRSISCSEAVSHAWRVSDYLREKLDDEKLVSMAVYSGHRSVHLYLSLGYEYILYLEELVEQVKSKLGKKEDVVNPAKSALLYKAVGKTLVQWLFSGSGYEQYIDWQCVGDVRRMVRLPGTMGKTDWCRLLWSYKVTPSWKNILRNVGSDIEKAVIRGVEEARRATVKASEKGEVFGTMLDLPPCVAEMVTELAETGELDHFCRFHVAAYLLSKGWKEDDIVDVFRPANDFKEHVTRYQVQHIARNKYRPYSCNALMAFGRCPYKCKLYRG